MFLMILTRPQVDPDPLVQTARDEPISRHHFGLQLGIILLAGIGLRVWLVLRGIPVLDSDEATVGLMALHMQHGDISAFFWGQPYMGTLEAFLAAPLLWLFGPSNVTLRLAMIILAAGANGIIGSMGAWLISRRVGLIAAALFAIAAPFATILSMRAFGGYIETLIFGQLILAVALAAPRSRWANLATGLLIGVATWTDFLVVPFALGALAIWWWQRRRDLLGINGLLLTMGTLVGLAPVIGNFRLYERLATSFTHNGTTIQAIGIIQATGATHPSVWVSVLHPITPLWFLLVVSLPILSGTFFGGSQSNNFFTTDYFGGVQHHLGVYLVALVLTGATITLLSTLTFRLVRQRQLLRTPMDVEQGGHHALLRRQYEAASILIALCYLGAFAVGNQDLYAIPRYLFPLYTALPVIVGQLERQVCAIASGWPGPTGWRGPMRWQWLSRLPGPHHALVRRLASWQSTATTSPTQRLTTAIMLAIVLGILGWNLWNCAQLTPALTAAKDHGVLIDAANGPLLNALHAADVRTVISNDYWVGLRLTYASHESIIVVMVTPQGHAGFNRYAPYVTRGLRDPRPAYLQLAGSPEAQLLQAQLSAGKLPGYVLRTIGPYLVALPQS